MTNENKSSISGRSIYLEGGCICGAHGVRGIVKVEPWCDSPRVLAGMKHIYLCERGEYVERAVLGASVSGSIVLLTVEGIDSREAAIAMRGRVIYLHRDDVPVPKGAMLVADMIGLPVVDAESGRVYGEITEVSDVPRGKLYTVRTAKGDVYYPSGDNFIKEIDAERGMLITPIPGFFDDDEI